MPTPMTSAGSTPLSAQDAGTSSWKTAQVVLGVLERPVGRRAARAVRRAAARSSMTPMRVGVDGRGEDPPVGDVDEHGPPRFGAEIDADGVSGHDPLRTGFDPLC